MAEQAAQIDHPVEEKIIEMEIERLRDFRNHPFHVKDDAEMEDLKNSIRRFGILSPIIVRPMQDGAYEIISGHRRKHAAKSLGYRKVPVIIRALEDDDAVISMVDSNLHREWISYAEILEQWRILTKERGVDIRVIDMPLLNTEGEENGITRMFIADLVLQILAYVAQTEREFIRQRQREGIALAHERGVKFGRPHITVPDNFPEVYELWCEDLISGREAGRLLQVDLKTFKKWAVAEGERIALEEKT